jgi:hypothetical protein
VWLNKNYSKVQRGEYLADVFPIKNVLEQGDIFSPLFFNCALDFGIRKGKQTWEWLKLNGAHPLLVSAYNVNLLGESTYACIL